MNKRQKTLSIVMLIVFWISCLYVPWNLTEGSGHRDTVQHSPIFKPPSGGSWKKREISSSVKHTWGALVFSYALLFVILADDKTKDD